jgi:hypothetical protein
VEELLQQHSAQSARGSGTGRLASGPPQSEPGIVGGSNAAGDEADATATRRCGVKSLPDPLLLDAPYTLSPARPVSSGSGRPLIGVQEDATGPADAALSLGAAALSAYKAKWWVDSSVGRGRATVASATRGQTAAPLQHQSSRGCSLLALKSRPPGVELLGAQTAGCGGSKGSLLHLTP